jgi:uncharacterized protein
MHGDRNLTLEEKEARLRKFLAAQESLLISFSGGVDSALLAIISREVLGENSRCVLLRSPLVSGSEEREARERAEQYGLSCTFLSFPVLRLRRFRLNPADRCYHCKKFAAELLKAQARKWGLRQVADGLNLSDYEEYRPGVQADTEEGILHPFVDAGMTKEDIRALAHRKGLPFWNRHASACLATRIPYGEEISPARLRTIEQAEDTIRSCGVNRVRVRLHGKIARIEVDEEEMPIVFAHRKFLIDRLKGNGIGYVTLDLEGYRSGSMDETLPKKVSRKRPDRP